MRLLEFSTGGYYHVYNRGTDKRNIFSDSSDYERFLAAVLKSKHNLDDRRHDVAVIAYSLMPNHFHLLLRQLEDGGVSLFMERFGNSYTKYFNIRNERSGRLFESTFKAKVIEDDLYLHSLVDYIHMNAKDLFASIDEMDQHAKLLEYPWSSYRHFQGLIHDPVLDGPEIREIFGNSQPLVLTNPKG